MYGDKLSSLLDNLGYFPSVYESRVLTYLISQKHSKSAKEISTDLDIPNSKTYPALNNLEELDLVERQRTNRPNKFYFKDPERLRSFLEDKLQEDFEQRQNNIDTIIDETITLWDPDTPELGKIAYIFHDEEIPAQITRLQKNIEKDIFYLVSPSVEPYFDRISSQLIALLKNEIRINLALPANLFNYLPKEIEKFTSGNLSIRESVWDGTSYIIRDRSTMLSITHRPAGDTGILTNDPLLVENISNCWEDTQCCIPSEDLIQLVNKV